MRWMGRSVGGAPTDSNAPVARAVDDLMARAEDSPHAGILLMLHLPTDPSTACRGGGRKSDPHHPSTAAALPP